MASAIKKGTLPTPTASFRPVEPSTATRKVKLKDKGSSRGALVTTDTRPRCITHESTGEEKTAYILLTHPDVIEVRDQPPAVRFTDGDKERHHTFDFIATRRDGQKFAIAVKPAEKARRIDLQRTLRLIAGQMPRSVADAVVQVSEDKLARNLVHRARLFHAVRRDPPSPADHAVASLIASLNGCTRIGSIVEATGLGADAFRATVRLIAAGDLITEPNARIDYDTLVGPGGAQ
jgi:hypothetical protein